MLMSTLYGCLAQIFLSIIQRASIWDVKNSQSVISLSTYEDILFSQIFLYTDSVTHTHTNTIFQLLDVSGQNVT